jgi:ParB family chromosome partitioning protein
MEDFTQEFTAGKQKDGMEAIGGTKADMYKVHPSRIRIKEGFNVRYHDADFEAKVLWLMDSIRANGYDRTKPISGFVALENGEHITYAIDGHRRIEAVNRLIADGMEIESIPVILKPRGTSMEDLTVDLYLSNESDPIDLYGQSVLVKRLIGLGMSEKRIAERMGMKLDKVNDLLQLAAAPSALRQLVIEKKVAASTAIDAIKEHGDKALDVIQKALATFEGTSVKVTPKMIATPEVLFKKMVTKQAPTMYTVIRDIEADPAFTDLAPATQTKLKEILDSLSPEQ